MPADGLRVVFGLGKLIHGEYFKRMFKDIGHEVSIEGLPAALTIGILQIAADPLVVADHDPKATFHPENGLDQALNIISVGFRLFGRAVNEGLNRSHLAIGALDGDPDGFRGGCEKSFIEALKRKKVRIQLGHMFQIDFDPIKVHRIRLPIRFVEKWMDHPAPGSRIHKAGKYS